MKAIGKNVLLQYVDDNIKTKSGLVIEEDARDVKVKLNYKAKVVSIGDKVDKSYELKEGDIVRFKWFNPEEMIVNGEKFVSVEDKYIMFVYNE
jgi:co-chaperonin GroES (HSP10)